MNTFVKIKQHFLGILSCLITAAAASILASKYQVPVMLFALLLGLAMHFLNQSPKYTIGINFCASSLLRIAVALLGVRIVFSDIISLGAIPVFIIIAGITFVVITFVIIMGIIVVVTF